MALLIFSCAKISKYNRSDKNKPNEVINISSQYWNMGVDSVNLNIHIEIPIKYFVFKKELDHFESKIEHTLIISSEEKGAQFYRESWIKIMKEDYYEDTRDPNRLIKSERNISLPFGDYNIFLNVQDSDSRKNLKSTQSIKLERIKRISSSLIFTKDDEGKLIQMNLFSDKQDTIWLRTQLNLSDSLQSLAQDMKINYSVNYKKSFKDSGQVDILEPSIQNLYYIPIPFEEYKNGNYDIKLHFLDDSETTSFYYGYKTKYYWTDDIDEVIGVMRYILSNSDYKKLKVKNDDIRWKFLKVYWKDKDPNPETEYNELLDELNDRVKFSNKNFSILMDGWKTDRGKIFIIHGQPQLIDEAYQDRMGHTFQRWSYGNGKEFLFIDRGMSGNYTLYDERF